MELLIKGLYKRYDGQIVLQGINLSVSEGSIVLIYGRNGSGKTTLLRLINLLEQPDSGEILFIDTHTYCFKAGAKRNINVQRKMVFIPQKPVMFSGSVWENILIGERLRKNMVDKEKVSNILEGFGLEEIKEKPAVLMSSGQKQKISLARGLILDCELFLLDEPLSYLDEQGKNFLKEYIYQEAKKGSSFIITTPDLKEWEEIFFNSVYLLKEGSLYDIFSKSDKDCMGYCKGYAG